MPQPYTAESYLESLRDGREVWIYGEKVADVPHDRAPVCGAARPGQA